MPLSWMDMVTPDHSAHECSMQNRALTTALSWLLAAFMLFLGMRGLFTPISAATGFGFPLENAADAFYLQIKGDRDLGIGIAFVLLLLLKQRRAFTAVVAASTVMPLLDCAFVLAGGRVSSAYALSVHGSALVYGVLLIALLVRDDARASDAMPI
jgi:hypothetical protein